MPWQIETKEGSLAFDDKNKQVKGKCKAKDIGKQMQLLKEVVGE